MDRVTGKCHHHDVIARTTTLYVAMAGLQAKNKWLKAIAWNGRPRRNEKNYVRILFLQYYLYCTRYTTCPNKHAITRLIGLYRKGYQLTEFAKTIALVLCCNNLGRDRPNRCV